MLNRTATPMLVLVGGLSGLVLAPDPALATMPVAANVVGLGLCTYLASSIMRRIGRRAAFVLASVVAGIAAIDAGAPDAHARESDIGDGSPLNDLHVVNRMRPPSDRSVECDNDGTGRAPPDPFRSRP